jgi:hypothetical protein
MVAKKRKGRTSVCSALFLFYGFLFYFVLSISYIPVSLCKVLSHKEIEQLAKTTFSKDLPGFSHTMRSPNSGKWFELETGLYLKRCLHEELIGFSLEIRVLDCFVSVPLDDSLNEFELRTTEYDVVTKCDEVFVF